MKVALALLLAMAQFVGPWRRTIYQILAKLDGNWGLSFLSLFLLNYESYSVDILYEASPCIPLGLGAVSGVLVEYYLPNLSQIG